MMTGWLPLYHHLNKMEHHSALAQLFSEDSRKNTIPYQRFNGPCALRLSIDQKRHVRLDSCDVQKETIIGYAGGANGGDDGH